MIFPSISLPWSLIACCLPYLISRLIITSSVLAIGGCSTAIVLNLLWTGCGVPRALIIVFRLSWLVVIGTRSVGLGFSRSLRLTLMVLVLFVIRLRVVILTIFSSILIVIVFVVILLLIIIVVIVILTQVLSLSPRWFRLLYLLMLLLRLNLTNWDVDLVLYLLLCLIVTSVTDHDAGGAGWVMRVWAIRGQGTFLELAQSGKLSFQFPGVDQRFVSLPDLHQVFVNGLENFFVVNHYRFDVVLLFKVNILLKLFNERTSFKVSLTAFFIMFLSKWCKMSSCLPWMLANAKPLILELLQSVVTEFHSTL